MSSVLPMRRATAQKVAGAMQYEAGMVDLYDQGRHIGAGAGEVAAGCAQDVLDRAASARAASSAG